MRCSDLYVGVIFMKINFKFTWVIPKVAVNHELHTIELRLPAEKAIMTILIPSRVTSVMLAISHRVSNSSFSPSFFGFVSQLRWTQIFIWCVHLRIIFLNRCHIYHQINKQEYTDWGDWSSKHMESSYESSNLKFLVVKSLILNYGKNVPCFDSQSLKTGFSYPPIFSF